MTVLKAALKYLAAGITTIPVALDGSKAPAIKSWRPFIDASPTETELRAMFDRDCGIAVLGGATSGNLEVIDFDRASAYQPWCDLVQTLAPGLIDRLPCVATPNGYHVYLRAAGIEASQKLAMGVEATAGKKSTCIIETRGEGGYVIAPPSPKDVHPSKITYRVISKVQIREVPTITDAERLVLINAARSFTEVAQETKSSEPHSTTPVGSGRPGDEYEKRVSWSDILRPHGWRIIREVGSVIHWQRPGKDDGGLSATTGFCGDKLYVFSSNAQPFASQRAYGKFSAFGHLNHGGDFKAASKALASQGFGEQRAPQQPKASVWAQLSEGLDNISRGSAALQLVPMPTDDDAPPMEYVPQATGMITPEEIGKLVDAGDAAFLDEPAFSRILALQSDDAAWFRAMSELGKKRGCKQAFLAKAQRKEKDKQRKPARSGDWQRLLLFKEKKDGSQVLENCMSNLVTILTHDDAWRGVIAFDEFANKITTRSTPPYQRRSTQWADEDALEVKSWIEMNYELRPSIILVCEAILIVAKRAWFNPLTDYLDSLDDSHGNSVIDTWLIDYFGAADTRYTREVGKKWLISAVARAYDPGCKVDTVLVLAGAQGLKKSRALSQLCPNPEWFIDGLSELGSKAQAEELEGKFIIELAELKGVNKDIDATKAFVSRQVENYRPAYARYSIRSPRKGVFAGTLNPDNVGFLKDGTGNRRWWVVDCNKQAPEITPELRDRLWAEARALYRADEKHFIEDESLIAEAEAAQEKHMQGDAWQELIEDHIVGKPDISADEILADCLKIEKAKWNNADSQRIGRIMMRLKWPRRKKRDLSGKQRWRYENPNYVEPPPKLEQSTWIE